MKRDVLLKTLWGDYYFNTKLKSVSKNDQGGTLKPMFAQFILENLWAVYKAFLDDQKYVCAVLFIPNAGICLFVCFFVFIFVLWLYLTIMDRDMTRGQKIVEKLGLSVPARELNSSDRRFALQSVMSKWLSLSSAVLDIRDCFIFIVCRSCLLYLLLNFFVVYVPSVSTCRVPNPLSQSGCRMSGPLSFNPITDHNTLQSPQPNSCHPRDSYRHHPPPPLPPALQTIISPRADRHRP